jgi:hypothetical protein
MEAQGRTLVNEFKDWKGTNDQIDDVCVVGVRL